MSTTEESASSTGGSSSGGDTASPPAPGSAGASQASQAAPLQPPRRAETTVDGGRGHKHVSVTLLEPTNGKKKLTAWCWQFVSRFTPSINGKNVVCLVKRGDDTPCNHLMTWAPFHHHQRGGRTRKGREHLVYLAEARHPDVDSFNLLGFWNRRGTDSLCPTTGKVTSPAEMPFLARIARLYLGIETTSCQSERNFSALAHLIGDLRRNMLAYKVERMMFIRLNRHLVDEVRALDAAVEQARARVARSAQKSAAAQAERSNVSIDLSL